MTRIDGGVAQVQASLAQARDVQVARVVAVVDAMPERGQADALIAPLRPRLAVLRPARPLGFARMMFSPLDTAIVPLAEWRGCGVPRPALGPLAAAVRVALPGFVDADGGFAGAATAFWPAAAAVLDGMAAPPGWDAAGLPAGAFVPVRDAVAAVLHEAAVIDGLADGRLAADDAAVWAVLSRSKARGVTALDSVVSVLLARLASPGRVASLAAAASEGDAVVGRVIDRLAGVVAEWAGAGDAAKEAARVAALLGALEHEAPADRRGRLDAIRREADGQCRRRFGEMAERLGAPGGGFDDGAVAALESGARDLQRLAAAARRLGSGAHYDAALAGAALAVTGGPCGLGLADRVRLVEILAGPERALGLLQGSAGLGR